jgi:hypothetical protein
MSYDLFLLRLPEGANVEAALGLFDQLETRTASALGKHDRHSLANLIMDADPRYEIFQKDYEEIGRFEAITAQEARDRDDSLELNGEADGKPMAQFILYDDRVVIHLNSGTTELEMSKHLEVLCKKTGYTAVDPQSGSFL